MSICRKLLVAAIVVATLALAAPAYADTIVLGRRVSLIDRVAGVPSAGRVACRAEGFLTTDNLQGHIACEEYQGAKRLRDYYRLLKVWRNGWVSVARDDTDLVAQQTKATLSGSTPPVSLCRVNTTTRRYYQVEHSTAVRWDNDTVTTRTGYSEKFLAPLLLNDPLCVPPPGPTPAANLDLSASHNPPSPLNGENFSLVFKAENSGDAIANGAVFTVNLPDAWTGVAADAGPGTSCDVAAGNVVTCNLGSLSAGEIDMISIQVANSHSVGASTVTGTLSSTTAGVASASSSESITFRAAADLELVKTAAPTAITTDDPNTYVFTYQVLNHGPNANTSFTVTDPWPSSLGDPTVSAGCSFNDAADTLSCVGAGPAAGGDVTFTATAVVTADVTNTATVNGDVADPNVVNNTDSATIDIPPPAAS